MSFLKNATPASAAEALFLFKQTCVTAEWSSDRPRRPWTPQTTNWCITTSSDGTRWAAQGDVITSISSLNTAGAWWVQRGRLYRDIDTNYWTEICFQHDGAGGLRVKISPRANFSGGTPSVSQVPSATDERILLGGGTDASPTYTAFVPSTGQRMQGFASEQDEALYFLWYPVGGGLALALFKIDRPQPNPRGAGGNLLDKERITFYAQTGSNCAKAAGLASEATGPMSIFNYGTTTELWGRCPPAMEFVYDSSSAAQKVLPGGVAMDSLYSEPTSEEAPFRYRRRAAVSGVTLPGEAGNNTSVGSKGTSRLFRFGGQTQSQPVLLDSVDPNTGETRIGGTLAVGDVLLPWCGTPLLL